MIDNQISKHLRSLAPTLLAACALPLFAVGKLAAEDRPLNVPPEGFTALFNGHDLAGWKGLVLNPKLRPTLSAEEMAERQAKADERMNKHWHVVDGTLTFDGAKFQMADNICTAKQYRNFEMLVDWKIEKDGDSGIYLRGSPQVQIWDPDNPKELKNGADKGSGALWNNQKNERFPLVRADNPVGQWNTFRIRMIDDRVSVWLNDKLVAENVVMENYWDRKNPIYPKEQIELQSHAHPAFFRNVFIKELP